MATRREGSRIGSRSLAFDVLFTHAAWCTGEVRRAVNRCLPVASTAAGMASGWNRAAVGVLADWGGTLDKMLRAAGEGTWVLSDGFPTEKPDGSVRDAAAHFDSFKDEQSSALASMVGDGITQWSVLLTLSEDVLDQVSAGQGADFFDAGQAAFEQLLGLHCLFGGDPPDSARAFYLSLAADLVRCCEGSGAAATAVAGTPPLVLMGNATVQ